MSALDLRKRLDKNIVNSHIFNLAGKRCFHDVAVIIDSGCTNTLIPLKYVKKRIDGELVGIRLSETMETTVLGETILTQAYSLPKMIINDLEMNRVMVFAAEFSHPLLQDFILLGLNVMNNWLYTTDRINNRLLVEERPHPSIEYKSDIYYNWISGEGNYIAVQDAGHDMPADV